MSIRFLTNSARFRSRFLYPLPFLTGASYLRTTATNRRSFSNLEGNQEEEKKSDKKEKPSSSSSSSVFDITQKWKETQNEAREFWNNSIFTGTANNDDKDEQQQRDKPKTSKQPFGEQWRSIDSNKFRQFFASKFGTPQDTTEKTKMDQNDDIGPQSSSAAASDFREMASTFMNILSGKGGSEETVKSIVKQARQSAEEGEVADKKSLEEVLFVLKQYTEELKQTADKFLGDVDLSKLYPTNLFYYMEYEDSIKTPSWKRRMHRFYPGININQLYDLNDYLQLAELAYADSVEEIREGLEQGKTPYELVFVSNPNEPNKPAHFMAVKRAQPIWSPSLEVIMVVRGTKTITDAMTDLLCDYEDYRGGKAHAGVLKGGRYLAEKHKETLKNLLESSGKRRIQLTLVGHSLGAGAASICGMEFNDEDDIEVEVIGFGCPALLSKELSENTKSYITTVIADDDCVPRLSAATVVNAVLDIMEYNWIPR